MNYFTKGVKKSSKNWTKKDFEKSKIAIPNISSKSFSLPQPRDELSMLKGKAILYLQQNKFVDAKHIFPRIADKTPKEHHSFLKIFNFYQKLQSEVMQNNNETDILPELLDHFETDDDFHTIPLLFHLSEDFKQKGDFGKSITLLGYSLDIATKKIFNDPLNAEIKDLIFFIYEQIGHNYLSLYDFEEAEKIFEKAISLKEDENGDVDTTIFLAHISACQFHLDKFDECKATVERNLNIIKKELKKLAPEEDEKILVDNIYKSIKSLMYIEETKQDFESSSKLHQFVIDYGKETKLKEVEIFYILSFAQLCAAFDKIEEAEKTLSTITQDELKDLPSDIRNDRRALHYELWNAIYRKKNDKKKLTESLTEYHEFLRDTYLYKTETFDISGFEEDLMKLYKEQDDVDSMNDLFYFAVGDKIKINRILSEYYITKEQYKEAIPVLKVLIKAFETNDKMIGSIYKKAIKDLLVCFEKTGNTDEKQLYEDKLNNFGCNIL